MEKITLSRLSDEQLKEMKTVFGENLARIRKEAGYSQITLSHAINMAHNFISELEKGNKGASFETLARLEVVLQTPVHQFFEQAAKPPAPADFQYPDPIDKLVSELHETLDEWNQYRVK
ncbi:MAG: helix-turn-helix domain-containing protein [Spirochaetaceae bacterium]|jgi:transcriptional regulator with XRE-family HTH domain|nr:helix-turn-helix domain-containing protein [Spirochaetaceae bacterium]